ncbi:MAG: P27 family phage terminase small subunit [Pirellulales bacterium]
MPKRTQPRPAPLPPPEHLSDRAKTIWRAVVPLHISPGRLLLVQTALEALDRCDEARRLIEKEGLTSKTETTGALHIHPAIRVEKDARAQFLAAWSKASLCWASIDARISPDEP